MGGLAVSLMVKFRVPRLSSKKIERITIFVIVFVISICGAVVNSKLALADSTLCLGFSDCTSKGYSNHNYQYNYSNSYWRAYSGNNCTNYAGYMLTLNGDPGHNVLMGNASNWDDVISANPSWGYSMNSTPAIGAIAQWEGGAGHVAYVEAIVNSATIIVSEDNYSNGPYSWRLITTSGNWPTRFLHIKDVSPAPPVVSVPHAIVLRVGTTLYGKANPGDPWTTLTAAASSDYQVSGNRIAYRDGSTSGALYVKDGIASPWTVIPAPFDDYKITPNLIIVRVGNMLYGKANPGDPWTTLTAAASSDYSASASRIAYRDGSTSGALYVKDGLTTVGWTIIPTPFDDYKISANLIILRVGTTLYGKANPGDPWTTLTAATSTDYQIADQRIAYRDGSTSGALYVKDGLSSNWTVIPTPFDDYKITPNLIILRVGNMMYGKQNPIDSWTTLTAAASADYSISASRIAYRDGSTSGALYVKDGLSSNWTVIPTPFDDYKIQ